MQVPISGMPCEGEVQAIVRLQVHNQIPLEYQNCLIYYYVRRKHAELPVPSTLNMRLTSDRRHISDVNACEVLLVWSVIGRMQREIRCSRSRRPGQGMPAQIRRNLSRKRHWKIVIGHLRVSQAHSARKSLMGCGSRHGANGMLLSFPSLFRNRIKARTYVRSSTHYTAAQATTTWTPCISCACAGTRLTSKLPCLTTEEGRG
jgi:hypothetical protein